MTSQNQRKRIEKKERRRNSLFLVNSLMTQGIKSYDGLIVDNNGQMWLVEVNKVDSVAFLERKKYI